MRSPQAIRLRKWRPRDTSWAEGCAFRLSTWTVFQRTRAPPALFSAWSCQLTLKGQTSSSRDPWQKHGGFIPRGHRWQDCSSSCQSHGAQPGPGPRCRGVEPPLGAWSLQTSTWVSLRNGASEAARTAWPTDFNGVTAAVLKPSLLGQPVSCVLHWDRTKTGGMGQRRPGTVRDIVLNVKTLS